MALYSWGQFASVERRGRPFDVEGTVQVVRGGEAVVNVAAGEREGSDVGRDALKDLARLDPPMQ